MESRSKPDRSGFFSDEAELIPADLMFGAMENFKSRVEKVAALPIPVLLEGGSGTGKGVLAREIHRKSQFKNGPFVPVNCPAIPSTLLESEMFGYEKGAFTGASTSRVGLAEVADGGTLFLDEIGDLELPMQAKLLHFLQDGTFCRVGGREQLEAHGRIICATSRDLAIEVSRGAFREDLYYRISAVTFRLPRLAERRVDIAPLADHFLRVYSERYHANPLRLSSDTLTLLREYDWPGNIRELENLIKTYVVLGSDETLRTSLSDRRHVEAAPAREPVRPMLLKEVARRATGELEREMIFNALRANHWDRRAAARELNISYRSLFYKIRKAGVPPKKATRSRKKPANGAHDTEPNV
jgi:two-component system response regulator AtoC